MAKKPKLYGERWKIVDTLGQGGQATAHRVRDTRDGSENWVLKKLLYRKRLGRFEREILALEALDSPHIPKTEDYSLDDPAYHVSPYLGTGLDKFVGAEPLDVDRALALFEQVVEAVRDAHGTSEVVVHRDIKPNNVVVSPHGEKAYLIDFGLCQMDDGELTTLTDEAEGLGNASYAAPECSPGREEEPGPPCDVYSLGKLLYWMVSGGRHINREEMPDRVLDRIRAEDRLVRFYVARLLRGTIVQETGSRWAAQRLLEEVARTRKLIARVEEYRAGGLEVLADGFDLDDAYGASWLRARKGFPAYPPGVQVIAMGEQWGTVEVGVAFEGPAGRDVRLERIDLALEHRAGQNEALVRIAPDRDGKPDEEGVLESFEVSGEGDFSARVERLRSRAKPVLRRGGRYWLLLTVAREGSEVALRLAPDDFMPQKVLFAQRLDGGGVGGGQVGGRIRLRDPRHRTGRDADGGVARGSARSFGRRLAFRTHAGGRGRREVRLLAAPAPRRRPRGRGSHRRGPGGGRGAHRIRAQAIPRALRVGEGPGEAGALARDVPQRHLPRPHAHGALASRRRRPGGGTRPEEGEGRVQEGAAGEGPGGIRDQAAQGGFGPAPHRRGGGEGRRVRSRRARHAHIPASRLGLEERAPRTPRRPSGGARGQGRRRERARRRDPGRGAMSKGGERRYLPRGVGFGVRVRDAAPTVGRDR